ncbi:hypothetical protein [Flavobacterium panacagri]|uniref:hypothetical protein n=1 Tax=Flavobacterium panacagri TaxID=3034146 RepID=UPI0025A5B368|nr:hypothetical protein [Flavobacterium panacagri]
MFRKIIFILLFIDIQSFAQENHRLTYKDLYAKDDLVYMMSNDSLFSGSIEHHRWTNDVLLSKDDFKNGYIILSTNYYNKSKKGIPYIKTYYYEQLYFKKKKEDKLDFDGNIYTSTYFDENENKILVENYSNGKVIYSCEYKDGKKNGKESCFSKEGTPMIFYYQNGKKIK